MNLTGREAVTKPRKPAKSRAYLRRVRALRCVICETYGEQQLSETQAHHAIHGRNAMARRSSDFDAIPLCEGHHQGLMDRSKIALHHSPDAWKAAYGVDTDYVAGVRAALGV